jgi:hypothetical protein
MGYDAKEILHALDSQPRSVASLAPDLDHLILDMTKEPIRAQVRRWLGDSTQTRFVSS